MLPELLFPALGLALAALGWPMATRRVGPNRWYGVRLPATFADQQVWYDANAVAGRDMIVLGAVIVVVAVALPRLTDVGDGPTSESAPAFWESAPWS